jgi:putative endonuclease
LGKTAESHVLQYFQKLGYRLLAQNERFSFAEADLVLQKDRTIVIVEVKQRSSWNNGTPEEAVGKAKLRKLALLAKTFEERFPDNEIQVDVVAVDGTRITAHLQNIEFS